MPKRASARAWTMSRMDAPALRVRYSPRFAENMTYRVELANRAVRDLEFLYLDKNAGASSCRPLVQPAGGSRVCAGNISLSLSRCPGGSKAETKIAAAALWQEAPRLSSNLRN